MREGKMMDRKVYVVYYSPTYSSKKNAIAIGEVLGEVCEIDVTQQSPQETMFTADDIVIFGTPVYSGRVPVFAMERFRRFKGNHTKCILTVTYGNRDYDDALIELLDMATDNGLQVIGRASLIAEHTYGSIQIGRPDKTDILAHKSFAKEVLSKIQRGDLKSVQVKGNRPYRAGGTGGKFRPLTDADLCVNCGLCKIKCPMYAIADDNKTIDNDKCIACFRCIKNCPVHAKNMDTPAYHDFAHEFSSKLEQAKDNAYFL